MTNFNYTLFTDGKKITIYNFDINHLFRLRYYEKKTWFGVDSVERILNIPSGRIKELVRSVEYREAAITFIKDNIKSIKTGSKDWSYALEYIFSCIEPEGGYKIPDIGDPPWSKSTKARKSKVDSEYYTVNPEVDLDIKFGGMKPNIIEILTTLKTTDVLFEKDNPQPGDAVYLKDKNNPRSKIDEYKCESESDFEGISREGLIARINDLIESREHWKNEHETLDKKNKHLKESLNSVLVESENIKYLNTRLSDDNARLSGNIQKLRYVNSRLSAEIGLLQAQKASNFGDMFNTGDVQLDKLLKNTPKKVVKIIRNKFMLAAHPDKLRDVISELSSEEQQAINRLFDYLQNKLK